MKDLLRRLKMLFGRERFAEEMDEEMRLHVELREERLAASMGAEDAHREARRRFGNATVMRERSRAAWGWSWLESMVQDAGYGLRSMWRTPGLTLVALLSLALGIGANTAIFSFLDALLLRSLPVKNPSQLVILGNGDEAGVTDRYGSTTLYSYPFFRQFRQKNTVFSEVATVFSFNGTTNGTLDSRDEMQKLSPDLVSGTFFPMLGVEPALGRVLTAADDTTEGAHPVMVISYPFWQTAFAGDPNVLSHTIKLGDTTYNIIGVAPAGFFGLGVGHQPDMWVPMAMMKSMPGHYDGYKDDFYQSNLIIGRLKPGVTREKAEAEVNVLYQQIIRGFPDAKLDAYNLRHLEQDGHVKLVSMAKGMTGLRQSFSDPLKILMGVTALVLLIACANIANLLLARSTARTREFAVRQALGAERMRLIRQLLTESLMLAVAGGALGIAFAVMADRLLLRMISGGEDADLIPIDVSLNWKLLAFTMMVTIGTSLLFGVVPALRASRVEVTGALKDRGSSGNSTRNTLGKSLVVAQVAISLVLAVVSVLFLRSLVNLTRVDTGFPRNAIMLMHINSDVMGLKADDPRMIAMFQEMEQRAAAVPGAHAASFASFTFNQGSWNGSINVPGMPFNENIDLKHNVIGNDYFKTMQIPLLAGRGFTTADTASSHRVAVLSESVVRDMFPPGVNPVGRHFYYGKDPQEKNDTEVIGVVKDVKFGNLQEKREYIDYVPNTQHPWGYGTLTVRYTGDFNVVAAGVRRAIESVNHTIPIDRPTTLDKQIERTITNERLVAQLSAFFGLLAVFLSAIGIYGLMSYMVSRRTNEIGIRMALGAARSGVRWMVMREILLLVVVGVAIGTVISLLAGRLVANLLYGLTASEPVNLALAMLALLAVALLAGYLPARRASRVSPMEALRYE